MCLPGVAMEVQHIFPEGGSALLQEFVGPAARGTLFRRRLRTLGLGGSVVDAGCRELSAAARSAVIGLPAGLYGVDFCLHVPGGKPVASGPGVTAMGRA